MNKLLLLSMLFISAIGFSQNWTYNITYSADAGNPGGINVESDAPGQGMWTTIVPGPQAANVWSPATAIPIPFDFYGSPVTHFKASQTGLVTFDTSAVLTSVPNENLPSMNLPDSTICGFWDEFTALGPTGSGDDIRTATFGTAPNRQFWIKWYSFEMGNPTVSFSYFAVVLEESTNNIYIVDQYGSASPLLTTTVGVQANATTAHQFGTNTIATSGNGSTNPDNDFYCFMPELLVADNAGVLTMDSPLLPLVSGLQNVDVTVRNFGTNDLTSFNVEWEAGGVLQTPLTYSGPILPSFTNSASLNLGSYTFPTGFTELKFWTTLPNGLADGDPLNDTLTINACTALSGTYAIGGVTPDFATINEANDALMSCGINGPVVFNIAPGIYNESLTTLPINGSSATNTVTFNGGSAATTSIVSSSPAVIALAGADYVTWKNMTVENTATADGFGFHLSDTSDYNLIDSCIILLDPTATTDVIGIVCSGNVGDDFNEGNASNYSTFSNNEISGGEMGIHMEGPTAIGDWMKGIQILNNEIHTMDDYGIYMDNQDSITVSGNYIYDNRAVGGDGIYCFDIANFDISSNNVIAPDYGIYVADGNFDFAVTGQSSVINNMVISETDYAIYLDDIDRINIYHNTAYGNPGMRINDFTLLDIRNNIFQSDGDYAFEADDVTAGNICDYNLYWTPATNTLFVKDGPTGGIYGDLAAWQTGEPTLNISSVEAEPMFVGPLDLHMNGPSANDIGDNTVGVLVDIDGDTRPLAPSTTVDIGADEYALPGDNAGVVSMESPIIPLSSGLQNVDVTVNNFGSNNLTSFNIEWEIDGAPQTSFTYVGAAIPPFSNSASLNLGSYNFPAGATDLKFWTTLPNGVADTDPTNDTLIINTCTALSGTYAIGGATPDFATINEANTALMTCGVNGPVVFNIAPGIYNETILTTTVNGSSATNTVTFNGGSSATTSIVSSGPAVVALDGATYITWKNMTVENTATTDGFGFHLTNASDYNLIDSCIILLDSTATADVIGIVCSGDLFNDYTEGNASNYTTFSNNEIFGGEMGIHMEGPTTNGSWMLGMQILNNEIHTADDYGIFMDNQDSITVSGNTIYDLRSNFSDGIYCFDIANFDISYNNVNAIDYGIYVTDGNFDFAVTGQSSIINNMVTSETDYAIYLDDINNINIYHNSAYGDPGMRINDFTLLDIRNNIFTSDGDYAFEADEPTVGNTVDYNLYWTPATNTLFVKDGPTGGIYADLAAWQVGEPTLNVASLEVEPIFAGPLDLHMSGPQANDVGDNTVGVVDDIDGDARPLAPSTVVDMGADEYAVPTPADDALAIEVVFGGNAPCADSLTDVYLVFQNGGTNTITSMTGNVDIAGAVVTSLTGTYSGTAATSAIDSIFLGTINTSGGGTITTTGWVTLLGDTDATNDTVSNSFTIFALPTVDLGVDSTVCALDYTLDAGNANPLTVWNWSDGSTMQTNTVTSSDTYWVEVTDLNGCIASDTVDVLISGLQLDPFAATAGFCPGDSVQLSPVVASNHPYTFVWSSGQLTQDISVNSTDVYTFTVTDSLGCTVSDSTDALLSTLQLDPFVATVDICPGDSVQLAPVVTSNNPYTFVWSSGQLTQDIFANSAGVYTFTATDSIGCSVNDSTAVTVGDNPIAGFTETITGEMLSITSTATNADSTVYDFGDGTVVTDINPTYSYTANGTFTVCQYVYNDCSSDTICTTVTATGIGIDELAAANVTLFPNPAEAIINITMNNASADLVRVMTSEGRLVGTHNFNGSTLSIDVSDLPSGVYFVNVEAANGTVVKKFIKE